VKINSPRRGKDSANFSPKNPDMKNLDAKTPKKATTKINIDIIKISLKSYSSLSFFLRAFFGSSTVKMETEARAKTFAIFSAIENIPTLEKSLAILAIAFAIEGHPSYIS